MSLLPFVIPVFLRPEPYLTPADALFRAGRFMASVLARVMCMVSEVLQVNKRNTREMPGILCFTCYRWLTCGCWLENTNRLDLRS